LSNSIGRDGGWSFRDRSSRTPRFSARALSPRGGSITEGSGRVITQVFMVHRVELHAIDQMTWSERFGLGTGIVSVNGVFTGYAFGFIFKIKL